MRATPNAIYQPRVLIKADPDQKTNHSFLMPDGTRKSFYLATKYSEDHKRSQVTMGIAVSECDEIKIGDVLLFTHLVLIGQEPIAHEDYTGPEKLFVINKSSVVCIIRDIDNGSREIIGIGDHLICDRLYYPEVISSGGIILSPQREQVPNRLRVTHVPEGIEDVSVGDIIVTYPCSDYELIFNLDNIQQTFIRCMYSRDVIAIDTADYSNY